MEVMEVDMDVCVTSGTWRIHGRLCHERDMEDPWTFVTSGT